MPHIPTANLTSTFSRAFSIAGLTQFAPVGQKSCHYYLVTAERIKLHRQKQEVLSSCVFVIIGTELTNI